jgi:hypothetical protein
MRRIRFFAGAVLASSLALLGCSKGNVNAPARVSGKLTYKNQPIRAGAMKLYTPDGVSYAAQIDPDGTYAATDVPTGELIVTVETEFLNPGKKGPKGGEAARRMKAAQSQMQQPAGLVEKPSEHYIKIPSKYANPKTSPLTVTLTSGRQVHDFDLTD